MGIDFFSQDFKFDLRRRLGLGYLRRFQKLEPTVFLNILYGIAGIDGNDPHALAFRLEIHNGHVGEYFVWPGTLRQSRLVPAVSPLQPAWRCDELALLHKATCILNSQ